jgi:hypothetical protein
VKSYRFHDGLPSVQTPAWTSGFVDQMRVPPASLPIDQSGVLVAGRTGPDRAALRRRVDALVGCVPGALFARWASLASLRESGIRGSAASLSRAIVRYGWPIRSELISSDGYRPVALTAGPPMV